MSDRAAGTAGTPSTAAATLPWMRVPVSFDGQFGTPLANVHGLSPAMSAALQGCGFSQLFPVQAAVWRELSGGLSTARDVCVCAPTGSGKTLAYALPILNALLHGKEWQGAHRLQALVVVPTRDLAKQVHGLLLRLCPGTGLNAVLAAAQSTVTEEAEALVGRPGAASGAADVVVATPGRLMAHLQGTPGFHLRHLSWLVVDEADRLLRQDYQGWLPHILQQLPQPHMGADSSTAGLLGPLLQLSGQRRLVKLVVSATLTRDPTKLSRLQLHCPCYVALAAVSRRYALPPSLLQHYLVIPAQHKPLALLALLQQLQGKGGVLVFASSLVTTQRLYLLLSRVPHLKSQVEAYSSSLTAQQRAAVLQRVDSGATRVLVVTDAMARGMDVQCIHAVVNYDVPVYPKSYVHRAGRTARAGRDGAVYNLVRPEEMRHFRVMLHKVGSGAKSAAVLKLTQDQLQPLRPVVKEALQEVQALLQADKEAAA